MEYSQKKKDPFATSCITSLRQQIARLLADSHFPFQDPETKEQVGTLLRKTAAKGFIRTHALLMNWLRELFEEGELKSRPVHELVQELPWGWDQSKKYLDALEANNLISYGRDSSGRKTCQLCLPGSLEQKEEEEAEKDGSLQVHLMLAFFAYSSPSIPAEAYKDLYRSYRHYYRQLAAVKRLEEEIAREKKGLRIASAKERADYVESIVAAYFSPEDFEGLPAQQRIVEALKQEPLMLKGIKKED
ncbi:MAG: hypothetical protein GF308_06995 [Candidatus Heimdallarchaeota archaeon]|nr:hypothetical protein [Candidatus Heimdallarchaeota archaeon]